MRRSFHTWMRVLLAGALALTLAPPVSARKGKHPTDLTQILSDMNEASKRLKTVSANLEYTKVTVLVDDKSTQSGQIFFRKGKTPEICINFQTPERKILLLNVRHIVGFLQFVGIRSETQKQELLHQIAFLCQVVLLNLVDLGKIDFALVLFEEEGLALGFLDVNANFRRLALAKEELARFR